MLDYDATDEEYLISFAAQAFNREYDRVIDVENCGIISVPSSYGYALGYQITTLVSNDYVVIHLYLNPAKYSRVELVRLEVIKNVVADNAPGDEVYVITGDISDEDGSRLFHWLKNLEASVDLVYFMDGNYASLNDGSALTWTN